MEISHEIVERARRVLGVRLCVLDRGDIQSVKPGVPNRAPEGTIPEVNLVLFHEQGRKGGGGAARSEGACRSGGVGSERVGVAPAGQKFRAGCEAGTGAPEELRSQLASGEAGAEEERRRMEERIVALQAEVAGLKAGGWGGWRWDGPSPMAGRGQGSEASL